MGRVLVVLCTVAALMFSCKEEPKPEELAAKAAVDGYEHLIAGRYTEYLAGVADTDSLPESYREQLLVNAIQFMSQQENERGGIDSVRLLRVVADTAARRADVFLLLCFGDSTKEEVIVPMVERPGGWKMK